jgi:PPK2 family polyphosphate:nucleotide phosphotransferase
VLEKLVPLQERLYAEKKQSLLVVLQAMDTGGKDGTIRKVMSGLNPASVRVSAFKVPCHHELEHDFLWRIHQVVPAKGFIGIFNRSHYEDVLITRVHGLVSDDLAAQRFEQIKDFERLLVETGTTVIKFYLHISKEEQRERLQQRIDDPEKRWKFNIDDLAERKLWEKYQWVYEEAISATSTKRAPWFVIPADHKWVRNVLVAKAILKTLEDMHPHFPKGKDLPQHLRIK